MGMISIEDRIRKAVVGACRDVYGFAIEEEAVVINETIKDFSGDWTVVVFPYVREAKKSPEQVGQEIGQYIKDHIVEVKDFNVVKGFLNLVIAGSYYLEFFEQLVLSGLAYEPARTGQKVLVEYSSPNTNKPLHLGHIRNNVLGFAVSGLLKAAGYEVHTCNLINDRGIHICKSMLAWLRFGNGETPETSGIKGDKLVGKYYVEFDKRYKLEVEVLVKEGMSEEEAKKEAALMQAAQDMLRQWEAGDSAVIDLWKKMNGWVYAGFAETYRSLGVSFDKTYYESETYLLGKDIVEEGLKKGVFFRKEDGSVWVDLTGDGLDQKLLLRGDGTSVYMTQDLGTADLKYHDFQMDKSIYVVGNEQDYHFKVLKLILQKLKKPHADGLYHLSYGMVDLPEGKMKSREGTVVDADDLIAEMVETAKQETLKLGKTEGFSAAEAEKLFHTIALGALKFYLLRVDPPKRILFNPAESIDLHGYTGPFVQYTYARIQSILRKHEGDGGQFETAGQPLMLQEEELELLQKLYKYGQIMEEAARGLDPSKVVETAYHLAKSYNKFYANHSVLGAADAATRQFRVMLSRQTGMTIRHAFHAVGIEVPERM